MKNNKKPLFRILKSASILILALAVVFTIIIILLSHFSQPIIEAKLKEAGFPTAKIGSFRLGLNGIQIENLELDEAGNKIGMIEAKVTFKDALQLKAQKLVIKDAVIDLTPFIKKKDENAEPTSSFTLPSLNIPARQIDISNLALSIAVNGGKAVVVVNGQGSDKSQMVMGIDGVIETADQSMKGKVVGKVTIDFPNNKAQADLTAASFNTKELGITEGQGHFDIYLSDKPVFEGKLELAGVTYTPSGMKPVTTPLKLTLNAQPFSSDAAITGLYGSINDQNGLLTVKINGKHNISENKGQITLQMPPTDFTKGVYQLSDIIPLSETYIQDVTGNIGMTVNADWQKKGDTWKYNTSGTLFLKDVEATVDDLVFTKVNTVTAFTNLYPPVFKSQSIAIGGFDSGLPLTNGVMKLSLDEKSKLTLHEAHYDLAKGTVTSSPFTVSLSDFTTDVVLTAKALDLGELFQIAPLEGLSAIGRVGGKLPLKAVKGKISLVDGVLETEGSGQLSYNPAEVPAFLKDDKNAAIANLRVALKAFSFDNLKIMLNGDLGGKQKISLKISGNNPDFYDGHPVNLNLNVEGPLESILKYNLGSSRIPDNIREQLENYENSHNDAEK